MQKFRMVWLIGMLSMIVSCITIGHIVPEGIIPDFDDKYSAFVKKLGIL